MNELDMEPSPADLAECIAPLSDRDRERLQAYWDVVIAEELGSPESTAAPSVWTAMGSGERARLRRYERRSDNTVLRLVTRAADTSVSAASHLGEAA